MMSEENPRAAMNLRGKQELLDSVFDFMRRHCQAAVSEPDVLLEFIQTVEAGGSHSH